MKKTFLTSLLFFITAIIICGQPKPVRLIIRGDDMGYSHSGNEAIIQCYKKGIEKSIEIIVPSPWFPEAVQLLKENPGVDVGIHLALTSEWDNIKWRPLTDCKTLQDEDGYFLPMVWPNKNYPGKSIKEKQWKLDDIEKEFRAQIEMAIKKIPGISHISDHMGCSGINDSVKLLTVKLAKEYHLYIDLQQLGVQWVGYEGVHITLDEKIESFTKMLNKLQPGNTYIFVDHPGFDGPELRAIHHIGYENVAIDRQGVTDLWTNETIKALIKTKQIQLISYKDLLTSQK